MARFHVVLGGQQEICYGTQSSENVTYSPFENWIPSRNIQHGHPKKKLLPSLLDSEVTHEGRNIHVAPQDGATHDIRIAGEAGALLKSTEIFLLFPGKDQKMASNFLNLPRLLQVMM